MGKFQSQLTSVTFAIVTILETLPKKTRRSTASHMLTGSLRLVTSCLVTRSDQGHEFLHR